MHKFRKICVYCGSSGGSDPAFVAPARRFGRILAENDIGLVYGGGDLGLMGASPTPCWRRAAMSPALSRISCKSRNKCWKACRIC